MKTEPILKAMIISQTVVTYFLSIRTEFSVCTGSSWLNQIERWFGEITAKRIRRGTFRSVKELITAIEGYIRENNKNPKPFVWTATPKSILKKLRKYKDILDTAH